MSRRSVRGDFQTPVELAHATCAILELEPRAVLEPTCGRGAFLEAARTHFPAATLRGLEIDPGYLREARERVPEATIDAGDCYAVDWARTVADLPRPLLVLGNPPWVTSDALTKGAARERPSRERDRAAPGLEGITGASNFDVSEWLLSRLIGVMEPGDVLAMIIKSSVAAKVLERLWRDGDTRRAEVRRIDARRWFGVAVEAVLLALHGEPGDGPRADYFPSLEARERSGQWGLCDRALVSDLAVVEASADLLESSGAVDREPWRSGLKHDCKAVMELERLGPGRFASAVEAEIELEESFVFALRNATDLARGRTPNRWVIVPQRHPGERTETLAARAPKLWAYLCRHRARLDRRKSRIYQNRSPFSVFGVGPYSFAHHKVAVSGLHGSARFCELATDERGQPTLVDDTCYSLACESRLQAQEVVQILESRRIGELLRALAPPGSKRPITAKRLARLGLPLRSGSDVAFASGIGETNRKL